MIEYIIEFVIVSLLSYLGCRLLINYCLNHKINRFWLLFCLCFSVLIPLIHIKIATDSTIGVINLDQVVNGANVEGLVSDVSKTDSGTRPLYLLILALYLVVVLVLLFRFYFNMKTLWNKKNNAELVNYKGTAIYLLDETIKPFTFLNFIFMSKADWANHKNKDELINHELYHKNLKHSHDILFIELLKAVFWFNPVLYAYKLLILSNHEYEVDKAIISSGFDPKSYTHILIDYTFKPKTKNYNLSSGFSLSLIKNRIHMISKFKQNTSSFKHYLVMGSLIVLLFLSSAFTLDTSGYFLAEKIAYSQKEHKLYLQGDRIEVNFQGNDISGRGSFSFLGKVDYLEIDDQTMERDITINVAGKKCLINQIVDQEALSGLGLDDQAKAFQVKTVAE
ncbi:MAG: hypothetical protein AAFX55_03025 [Bacteroidota bacterium]